MSRLYDALSRLSSITSGAGSFGYSYFGNTGMMQQLSLPNGAKSEYSYDGLQRLTSVNNKTQANGNISQYDYGYDSRDVRTFVEATVGDEAMQRTNFGYDTTDQLVSEVSVETPAPQVNNGFSYDAMGNRSASSRTTSTETYATTYNSNRLKQ